MELELLKKMAKTGVSIRSFRNLPYLWEYDSAVEQVRKEDLTKLIEALYVTDLVKNANRSVITKKGLAALRAIDHTRKVEEKKAKAASKVAIKAATKTAKAEAKIAKVKKPAKPAKVVKPKVKKKK